MGAGGYIHSHNPLIINRKKEGKKSLSPVELSSIAVTLHYASQSDIVGICPEQKEGHEQRILFKEARIKLSGAKSASE